jgi:pyridoxamine 5'-phosphate oxidase
MALLESDVGADPIVEVQRWLDDAVAAPDVHEPYAMQVATSFDDHPTVRTVLLRGLDQRGFMFVTNLESTKGRQLVANPRAALTLVWTPLSRQVCATGAVERVSDDDIVAYWNQRPRGSRLGAWASRQSTTVTDRATLDAAADECERRFAGTDDIPVPPWWGGWWIVPDMVELWAGREDRLHDRLRWHRRPPSVTWRRERVAP